MSILGLMTELDAVNAMLEFVSEPPINTIPSTGVSKGSIAYKILTRVSRSVQGEGLACNTDEKYTLIPDSETKEIKIPETMLSVIPTYRTDRYIIRDNKLYNIDKQTFQFDEPVKATVIHYLSFESLPQHVRDYVAMRAGFEFQKKFLTDSTAYQLTKEDVQVAYQTFRATELRIKRPNLVNTSPDLSYSYTFRTK